MAIYVVPLPAGARDDEEPYLASLTLNSDCVFTIRAMDPDTGQPKDWDCDVWVFTKTRDGQQQKIVADISGPDAVVCIESEIANQIKHGTAWQAVRSQDGQPSRELPLLVAAFVRADGGLRV